MAQAVRRSPPTAGVPSSRLDHSMWVSWWTKRGLGRFLSGFLPFSPTTNFIPPFLHTYLIHFVSFHLPLWWCVRRGRPAPLLLTDLYSSRLIPRPNLVLDTSWGYLFIHLYVRGLFFQGLIGREIRTTVRIRWSFAQMCRAISLACQSIATHSTCQFWARSEPVNRPKTIESPAKCGVHALIRFLYSENRRGMLSSGIVLLHDYARPHTAAATKSLLESFFFFASIWSSSIIRPDLALCDFHLFPRMKRS